MPGASTTHVFSSLGAGVVAGPTFSAVTGVLDFLRVGEETALESDQVARVVEETQARVERYYYELRKKLFDFDEVCAPCMLSRAPAPRPA